MWSSTGPAPAAARLGASSQIRTQYIELVDPWTLEAVTRAQAGHVLALAVLLVYPLGALAMAVTMLNSMVRTLVQGGVRWRGTHYPLAALKANRV